MIIPFAAYEEQKEVISIIEEVFSDLDNAIDNFKKAKDQFKIYRQAVLKQAFEGKLIGSKVKWGNVSLGNLGEWNGGGTPSKSKKEYWLRGKIPWVSPKDMKADEIIDTQDHITESAIENSSAKMIEKHSILIVVRSGILRHSFPVAITNMKCAVNQDLKALKPFSNVFFKYVLWILKAYGSDILHKCSKKGTTVQSIEFPIFKNYKIPIPEDIEEQKEIVREIEARFSVCDKMEETINNSLKQAEALRQSILKQAFEGRLTEDWRKKHPDLIRGENSAKALLDRIKKEREALKNTKKRKK
jgi:type I restriction enzyme S subunit